MSDQDLSAYLGVFIDEVDEQIQVLEKAVLDLEQDGGDRDTIQRIFRAAHTLKGSSAAMGFETMKELTHKVENVFDAIRNDQLKVNSTIIDAIFESIDALKDLKESIIQGGEDVDVQALMKKLDGVQTSTSEPRASAPIALEGSTEETKMEVNFPEVKFDEFQKEIIKQAEQTGYQVFNVYVSLTSDCMLRNVRAFLIQNNLKEIGEIIASFPAVEVIEGDDFSGNLVYCLVTTESQQKIISIVNSISDISIVKVRQITETNVEGYTEGKVLEMKETVPEKIKKADTTPKVKVHPTVRVDVERLEHLLNLVGELVIDQTRLAEVRNRLSDRYHNDPDFESFHEVGNHLGQVISELQEGMMKTRMLPIEQLFNRFPRMVRDTSAKAHKEIDFIIEGKETELDRNLIEEIGDPIIHLLRNAIDHGVELPDARQKAGKPRKGTVVLRAAHEENHIVITIADDGKGIQPEVIKKSALKKGIVTEAELERMTDKDIIFLIFRSGFSTAAEVTDISGRGVGMDIVRNQIDKLGGMIDIESDVGKGTTFTVKLPLTLAIIRSLLVQLGDKEFAIPLSNVQEIVRLEQDEIKTIKNQEVGIVRERVLPLVRMHSRLGVSEAKIQSRKRLLVIVVGLADKRVGLIVDRTLGNQEIVIKPLGKYIGTPNYIAGATIMGDGNVALILDTSSIVRQEGTVDSTRTHDSQVTKVNQADDTLHMITIKLGQEEYGIEVDRVIDILTVPEISHMMNAPRGVLGMIDIRERLVPIVDLRKQLGLEATARTRKARIVVIDLGDRWMGVLVDAVTEVKKVSKDKIEQPPENINQVDQQYVSGICNLPERLIILLEIDTILAGMTGVQTN